VTPETALIELLGRVGASQSIEVLVNNDELSQWPDDAVAAMKVQRLIVKAQPASGAVCPGCERECAMPVHTLPGTEDTPVSFVVCDKRSDTNRVQVSSERLIQWRCNANAVCGFVAESLNLRRSDQRTISGGLWKIGIATGDKRSSQMLCLQANGELDLVAGNNKVPLAELIEFHDGRYLLDGPMVRRLVDTTTTADPRYTPSDVKREARKLDTQAMYKEWQKEFRSLLRKRPDMSDVSCSRQIAKMRIAQGRKAETIRKNMKK
jgi:hypothetical protein